MKEMLYAVKGRQKLVYSGRGVISICLPSLNLAKKKKKKVVKLELFPILVVADEGTYVLIELTLDS